MAGTTDIRDHSRIRDEAAEVIATARATDLARRHQHRFHVLHVSTGAELVSLTDPSIQVIATDHAPHTLEEKAQSHPKSPSGLLAVESSLALLLDRCNASEVTLPQIAHWMSDAPARVWGITGKGRIANGYGGDL